MDGTRPRSEILSDPSPVRSVLIGWSVRYMANGADWARFVGGGFVVGHTAASATVLRRSSAAEETGDQVGQSYTHHLLRVVPELHAVKS